MSPQQTAPIHPLPHPRAPQAALGRATSCSYSPSSGTLGQDQVRRLTPQGLQPKWLYFPLDLPPKPETVSSKQQGTGGMSTSTPRWGQEGGSRHQTPCRLHPRGTDLHGVRTSSARSANMDKGLPAWAPEPHGQQGPVREKHGPAAGQMRVLTWGVCISEQGPPLSFRKLGGHTGQPILQAQPQEKRALLSPVPGSLQPLLWGAHACPALSPKFSPPR